MATKQTIESMTRTGEIVDIPHAPGGSRRELIEERYEYGKDKCRCPACGGLGMPWGGWFTCESCSAIALVEDGRCFVLTRPGPA